MIEKRFIQEIRAIEDSRTIEGKAIAFESESRNLGGFTEIIERSAIDQTLIDNSDIVFLYNHDKDAGVLARSKNGVGTLNVEIREDGVYFSFEAPNTSLGNDTLESVKRGDLDACSFAFTVKKEDQKLERRSSGIALRTISKINSLHDLSIVVTPAYEATEASVRAIQDELNEMERLEREAKEAEEREAKELAEKEAAERAEAEKRLLEDYYSKYDNVIEKLKR